MKRLNALDTKSPQYNIVMVVDDDSQYVENLHLCLVASKCVVGELLIGSLNTLSQPRSSLLAMASRPKLVWIR